MKKYKFIWQPVFFIFNLLFATWLVFQIEEISPSDFGKYKSLFEGPPALTPVKKFTKQYLKQICTDYKTGALDSVQLEQQINRLLTEPKEVSDK